MKRLCLLSLGLLSASVGAAELDGSVPIVCVALQGRDCLPTQENCKPLERKSDRELKLRIDVANKTIKSPFRTSLLPIQSVSNNTASLVLQGASLEFVWNATINRATERLTITVADREGAYVIFGQCKPETSGSAAKE